MNCVRFGVLGAFLATAFSMSCWLAVDDSFSRGSGDGARPDAGDASADANVPDVTTEISVDAGTDACAGYRFCDRFDDRTTLLLGAWDEVQPGRGSATLGQDGLSAPGDAFFTMPAQTDPSWSYGRLTVTLPPPSDRHLDIRFDLKVDTNFSAFPGESLLVFIGLDDGYTSSLVMRGGGIRFSFWHYDDSSGGDQKDSDFVALARKTWLPVSIEEDLSKDGGRIRAKVGDTTLVDEVHKLYPFDSLKFSVSVGVGTENGTPNIVGAYDNVRIR